MTWPEIGAMADEMRSQAAQLTTGLDATNVASLNYHLFQVRKLSEHFALQSGQSAAPCDVMRMAYQ